MSFCSHCGQQVSGSESYCPGCGRPLNITRTNTCSGCGAILNGSPAFCQACGRRTGNTVCGDRYPVDSDGREVRGEKSTVLAILLSFFIPAVGVMYAGDVTKGVIILIVCVAASVMAVFSLLFWLVSLVAWIYGMYESYRICDEDNRLWHNFQDKNFGPRP